MDIYPDWLGQSIILYDLPWTKAKKVNITSFLSNLILHDSYWVGIYTELYEETVAIIRWNISWYEELGYHFDLGTKGRRWPLLLIQFKRIYRMQITYPSRISDTDCILDSAESHVLVLEERERLFELAMASSNLADDHNEFLLQDDICKTSFTSVDFGKIELFHNNQVNILCLNHDKEIIEILF